jgi:ABC-type antimicrobial peptide transport system permease subunit
MSRVTFGGRVSLSVGIIATSLSFIIGVSWGGIAGYFGGRVDALMMRIVDVLYTFPLLIFVILLTAFFANPDTVFYELFHKLLTALYDDVKNPQQLFKIVFVFAALGSMSWLTMARIVRGQVIALRGQLFVEAARAFAERMIAHRGDDAADLAWGFTEATTRPPTAAEVAVLTDALARERARFASDAAAAAALLAHGESPRDERIPAAEHAAWAQVAATILNLSETVTRN